MKLLRSVVVVSAMLACATPALSQELNANEAGTTHLTASFLVGQFVTSEPLVVTGPAVSDRLVGFTVGGAYFVAPWFAVNGAFERTSEGLLGCSVLVAVIFDRCSPVDADNVNYGGTVGAQFHPWTGKRVEYSAHVKLWFGSASAVSDTGSSIVLSNVIDIDTGVRLGEDAPLLVRVNWDLFVSGNELRDEAHVSDRLGFGIVMAF